MGYQLKALPCRLKYPKWKIQFVSRKKEHNLGSSAKHPSRAWDIPKDQWGRLGLHKNMSLLEARTRVSQLNAQKQLKRKEELIIKCEHKIKIHNLMVKGHFPKFYKDDFENRYFYQRNREKVLKNKVLSHWRAAQKMIFEVGIDPSDWYDNSLEFYDWFFKKKYSPSYMRQILKVANLWGFYLANRLGKPFMRIQVPKGYEKQRLYETYFEKIGQGKCSDPIRPDDLEKAKESLSLKNYNWLYLSVWMGLRPKEIDDLKNEDPINVLYDKNNTAILWVQQTKIISVPHRYRWKLIPLIFSEQKKIIEILETKNFKRPLVKTVKKNFGENTNLYGGRKGFADLMLEKKQNFINISQWLGHSNIERTWKNYKNKLIVHYDKTG